MKIKFEGYSEEDLKVIKNKFSLSSYSDAARYAASKIADEIRHDNNRNIKPSSHGMAKMVQGKKYE
jgi:hypothetical protein